MKQFTVEIRTDCAICGGDLPPRYRTYCSKKCRGLALSRRHAKQSSEWARKKRAEYQTGKLQCAICGGYFIQVCSHTIQAHGLTGREYREEYNLPVKRGVIPSWYREWKGDQAIENGTVNNLKKGQKYWYTKGDPRAIKQSGFKGKHRKKDEYWE